MYHKQLLWKYISHIIGCEGISYLSECHTRGGDFSDDELKELRKLADMSEAPLDTKPPVS